MDMLQWMHEQELDLLMHIQDELRSDDMRTVYTAEMMVCTVCGNETPHHLSIDVSDDPDAVVLVGVECIMGWFAWNELQAVPSYIERFAQIAALYDKSVAPDLEVSR